MSELVQSLLVHLGSKNLGLKFMQYFYLTDARVSKMQTLSLVILLHYLVKV